MSSKKKEKALTRNVVRVMFNEETNEVHRVVHETWAERVGDQRSWYTARCMDCPWMAVGVIDHGDQVVEQSGHSLQHLNWSGELLERARTLALSAIGESSEASQASAEIDGTVVDGFPQERR